MCVYTLNKMNKKWVLITGASSGFGEEFARQYAQRGHPLVLVARRLERLEALAESLRQQYAVKVVVEAVDLSELSAISQLHRRLRDQDIAIDILINNAGYGLQGKFIDTPLDELMSLIQLDIASLTAVTHVFAQEMRGRKHGEILLVASLLGYLGTEHLAVYAAAKSYVQRLGEALHRELKSEGIQVTVLSPGLSDTGFAKAAQMQITPVLRKMMMQAAPVVRAGIRALEAGRMSVVPGFINKLMTFFIWATPRSIHQTAFDAVLNHPKSQPKKK